MRSSRDLPDQAAAVVIAALSRMLDAARQVSSPRGTQAAFHANYRQKHGNLIRRGRASTRASSFNQYVGNGITSTAHAEGPRVRAFEPDVAGTRVASAA